MGSMNRFLAGKKQDQAGNVVYKRAYAFFEKKRILEGALKSKSRIKNEENQPEGFELRAPSKGGYFYATPDEIEEMKRARMSA